MIVAQKTENRMDNGNLYLEQPTWQSILNILLDLCFLSAILIFLQKQATLSKSRQ